jgi:NADH:ubiquinone oxidoreductase subunit K
MLQLTVVIFLIDSCYILSHKNLLEILKYWSIEVDINSDKFHKTNNYHNCSQQWLQEVR